MMKTLLMLGLVALLAACAPQAQTDMAMTDDTMAAEEMAADAAATETMAEEMEATTVLTELFGDEQVPPVATLAIGSANVSLSGDMLEIVGTFENLESDLIEVAGTPAHVHQAPRGENGPVVLPLVVTPNPDMRSGAFSLSEALDAEQLEALQNGEFYINVHTENNPGGELRGQIEFGDAGGM